MNSKQLIVNLMREKYKSAEHTYRLATSEMAAAFAAHAEWDKIDPTDDRGFFPSRYSVGGMTNPYDTKAAEARAKAARVQFEELQAAYQFAVDTFLQD